MRTKQFVAVAITPAVLILGLLVVAVTHFQSVLSSAEARDLTFRGQVVYNSGPLQMIFRRDGGAQRPSITYSQQEIVQYTEWSSSLVVDGTVYSLWDQNHGYYFDDAQKQAISTITGPSWQLIQSMVVYNGALQMAFTFVPEDTGLGRSPHEVTLVLVHDHSYWLDPSLRGATLRAGITTRPLSLLRTGVTLRPCWTMTLAAVGAQGVQAALQLINQRAAGNARTGTAQTWADEFVSTYSFSHPQVNMLTPVATETVKVEPVQGVGTTTGECRR
jgi:hypothetical protein